MDNCDFIIISQSEVVNYEKYAKLPLDRLDIYKKLIYPRMVYYKEGFRSHLDMMNIFRSDVFWVDADPEHRRDLMSIWNLPGFVGPHLANYLTTYDIHACVINNFDAEWDRFCEVYDHCDPKPLVGISTTFYLNYAEIRRLTKKLKKAYPDMSIVLGGAFINGQMLNDDSTALCKAMKRCGVDFSVFSFNSEKDLKDLIVTQKAGQDLASVNNLIYSVVNEGSASFKVTQKVWNDPVLDEAPANWDQLELPYLNHTVQMRTSSGCPFSCAFCSYPETAGGFFTMPVEHMEKHIQSVLKQPNINKIIFLDDTFNVPAKRFKDLCQMFAKYDFEWFSFLRVQFVTDEIAQLMKASGCRGVYLGLESANNDILKNMNKRATREEFAKGIGFLKKYDITVMAAFIVGFPGETEETLQDNKNFIETLGIDFYTLKEFYYMENTPIHGQRDNFGLTGMGSEWAHDTMDSTTASEHKMRLFKEIDSIFIDPDTSLWYIAYLYDQGFSIQEIASMQKNINALMVEQMNGSFNDDHLLFHQLAKNF